MRIHEISTKSGVSVAKLRKLDKLGVLKYTKGDGDGDEHRDAAAMRFALMRKQPLPLAHVLTLLDAPDTLYDLGKYERAGRDQITALGDVAGDAAPVEVRAAIGDAAGGDAGALDTLGTWLRDILPTKPVSYHWVAARLLFAIPEGGRKDALKQVSFALMHLRKRDDVRAYWTHTPAANGSKATIYFAPRDL